MALFSSDPCKILTLPHRAWRNGARRRSSSTTPSGRSSSASPRTSPHLVRVSRVCKLWRRIISDPGFIRRYREFHRTPPLLGFLHNTNGGRPLFFPTMTPEFDCCRLFTLDDRRRLWAVDCRHGRVLLQHTDTKRKNFLVWDPITGGREKVPTQQIPYWLNSAMVLCAAAGCDHCDCLGGPFLVVWVSDGGYRSVRGCVYSSKARAWGTPASITLGDDCCLAPNRGALVGGHTYFILHLPTKILKYDLDKNLLHAIDLPLEMCCRDPVLMPTEDGSLGFADIRSSSLYLWRREVDPEGVAGWVPCRVIELQNLLPVNISSNQPYVIGFAEKVNVMFVRIDISTFMIELKSGRVRKVSDFGRFYNILPFMSFYTPGSASSIMPLAAEKN